MTDAVDNAGGTSVVEGQEAAASEVTEGQRLYGGKYATVEELEAAYAATTAATVGNDGLTAKKEDAANDEGTSDGEAAAAASDALKAAGLDQNKYTQEFATGGDLSAESYAELEAKGFSRELVDVYMDGMKSRRAAYEADVFAPAGGKEGYGKLLAWAGKNLDDASISAFNDAVTSGDRARAKLAVSGLSAQFKGTSAAPAALLNGKSGSSASVQPFASRDEVHTAMRDPRYRSDPAYRAQVAERLRDSTAY